MRANIKIIYRIFTGICISGLFLSNVSFGEGPLPVQVKYKEVIVKVEEDVIKLPEGEYGAPLEDIEISSDEMVELNRKFNLQAIEKMFAIKGDDAENADEGDGLENLFLFKFPELNDAEAMIAEYSDLEDVIYAEENMPVGIF